nr:unnamed protein product [Meloidogyne enterolobii]
MIGINVFLRVLSPSSPYFWHANVYLSMFLNISGAINAPILYINSTDYKAAFRKQFAAIKSSFLKLKYYLFNPTQQSTTMVQKY